MILKKFRAQTLLLHMLLTSVILIVSLSCIFAILYADRQKESRDKLQGISEKEFPEIVTGDTSGKTQNDTATDAQIDSDGAFFFNARLDKVGNVDKLESPFDTKENTYRSVAEKAWNSEAKTGKIRAGKCVWLYQIVPASKYSYSGEGEIRSAVMGADEKHYILSGIDITAEVNAMKSMALLFAAVGFAAWIGISFISYLFINRSMRPVLVSWKRQQQFVADASHELKTPVSIITANYDVLMANQEETVGSQMKWLDNIKVGTDRMEHLISRMLSLAKVEGSEMPVQLEVFNLSELIAENMEYFKAGCSEKQIYVSAIIPANVQIKSAKDLVLQIFMVLYENAVKYTPVQGRIRVALVQNKDKVICTVKNSGEKIPEKDLAKIFDRFYRADKVRSGDEKSYGLGLAIAKACITKLGGQIAAGNAKDGMTTFEFTIPCR